jgi:hypothetical protein
VTLADRAIIAERLDRWLSASPQRRLSIRRALGLWYVTLLDGDTAGTTTVSRDSWEDAAEVLLRGGGIAA